MKKIEAICEEVTIQFDEELIDDMKNIIKKRGLNVNPSKNLTLIEITGLKDSRDKMRYDVKIELSLEDWGNHKVCTMSKVGTYPKCCSWDQVYIPSNPLELLEYSRECQFAASFFERLGNVILDIKQCLRDYDIKLNDR